MVSVVVITDKGAQNFRGWADLQENATGIDFIAHNDRMFFQALSLVT